MKIEVLGHASIKLSDDIIIYFDPYEITDEVHDADYIFITHDHYDHYDEESINKIIKDTTKIILPKCLEDKKHDLVVEPNNDYIIDNLRFKTIPSYNINSSFHPKEKEYVGYNILLKDEYYYIMGDTDQTPETNNVKTDYCFIPIGGTYTMNVYEAIDYINDLKPKVAIPIHYGKIVGDVNLGEVFREKVNKDIKVDLLIGGEEVDY